MLRSTNGTRKVLPSSFALTILRISEKPRIVAIICKWMRFSTKLELVSSLQHAGRIALGTGLVLLGIAGLILPVMPGWVFLIPGLLILADYFPPIRRLVEFAKKRFRDAEAAFRKDKAADSAEEETGQAQQDSSATEDPRSTPDA